MNVERWRWTAAWVGALSLAAAVGIFALERRAGTSQQRISVRWTDGIGEADRRAAEATLTLEAGEEVEPGKWVYSLGDRSRAMVRRLVTNPLVADTAHIDRERFRIVLDAPDVPPLVRRFLEARLAMPVALVGLIVGLAGIGVARRELGAMFARAAMGPADAPRHAHAVRTDANHVVSRTVAAGLLAVQDDWDWWAARAYYPIICVILALMVVYTGWHGHELATSWDGWTIGDWLITYSGGFVRRGLSGEIVLATSTGLGLPANLGAWVFFVLVFAVFCAAFAAVLRSRRLTFWFFLMCLSPAFLFFTLYNPDTVGRKDGLLFASVAMWALAIDRKGVTKARAAGFALLAFALTLMHELFFFFTPYFVLVSFLHAQLKPTAERWWLSALVPAGSAGAVVLVMALSGSLSAPALCDRLVAAGAPARVCEGVLSYGHESAGEAIRDFREAASAQTAAALASAAALTILPPMLFLLISARAVRIAYLGIAALVGAVVFSAPLFILAIDWGRWLAIHATLATVACAIVLPGRGVLPFRPAFGTRAILSVGTGLCVLGLMFGFSVKHCCRATLLMPFTPTQMLGEAWQRW